jgi:uncharacterized membrane protein
MAGSMTGRERYRTNKQDLDWSEERADKNVGREEAAFSGIVGAALIFAGVTRRSMAGAALAVTGAALLHRGLTQYCPVYDLLGANTNELGRRKVATRRALKTEHRITIERPPAELFLYWRNLENLPRVMRHLHSVEPINNRLSHWVVKPLGDTPGAPSVEWDAEIVNEVENELIGWRSLNGSDVDTAGSVRFRPVREGRATEVIVTLQYDVPGGPVGAAIAKLLGHDPERLIEQDLRQFKAAMESENSVGQRRP